MCGICGELRFDNARPSRDILEKMSAMLARRGPDHDGMHLDGPVALAHRRLSIIDLTDRSNQPMVDVEAGLVLVFNGAIYNYPQLRSELISLGHRFRSSGDSEVVLRAYAEWGEDCPRRLHGMFAFAIWDRNRRQLFLARDRFGVKPLYLAYVNGAVRFASSVQALLAGGGIDTGFDPVALHHHFTLHAVVPAPRTVLRGIRKLPPATSLSIGESGARKSQTYWSLEARRPSESISEWEWIEQVREALIKAVKRRRVIADVPVGVLLSGGLDSSLLAALLVEAGVPDLMTFSVGFEDQPEERGNEFEYSRLVAGELGTRHHEFCVPNTDVLQRLPEAVDSMSEPMVGQDAVAFYLLSERVSEFIKVVQSGQGADEVFGGYFWYPKMMAASGPPAERFGRYYFDRDHSEFADMTEKRFAGPDYTTAWVGQTLNRPGADSFLDQVLRMDVTALMVDDPVKRVDNMTMAWGLEARVPFLDHELVELTARIPPELKLRSDGKHILKSVARGCVPDAVIDRPKAYFPVPALKYVRGPFLEFMREVLDSDACRTRGLYRAAYVERLLKEPEKHFTQILGSKLWHLALLEFWLQRNVDRAPAPT